MSRFFRPLIALLAVSCLVPVVAFARIDDSSTGLRAAGGAAGLSTFCSGSASSCIATIVGRAINIVLTFVGIVLVCYFLYGGFLWMTSGGSAKQAGEAKEVFLNAVIGTFVIAASFAVSNFVLTQLGNVVTGDGSSVASSDDPSAGGSGAGGSGTSDSRIGSEGGPASCCYAASEDCVASCLVTPITFNISGRVTEAACRTVCSDSSRRYLCSARPAGTPTCSAPARSEDASLFGSALDACNRFRCGGTVTPGRPAPSCATPPTCPVDSCPVGVRSLDDLVTRWGRSLPTTPGAADACRSCINTLLTSSAVQTAYPGLDGTCVPAITNAWRTACATQCGTVSSGL